jgi:hypothetical protein
MFVPNPCPICGEHFNEGDLLRPIKGAPGPRHVACAGASPDFDRATGEVIIDDLPVFVFEEKMRLP